MLERSLAKKNGMILVTGPTGSGKTTTLYTMLSHLNTREKKIITLEDPIEYDVEGVIQSEVDEKKGFTFETGLKACLRQDPDIIMV
jgi:type II secretory ATPase GspE/PulE/Tfp pilus assembly ATPase PilB-like protein